MSNPLDKSTLPEVALKVLAGVDPPDCDVISQLTEASPDWPTWRSILIDKPNIMLLQCIVIDIVGDVTVLLLFLVVKTLTEIISPYCIH